MAERIDSETLSPAELEEAQRVYESDGVAGCLAHFQRKNEQWKKVPLKVGVIGSTGAGKSSFINAVRELRPGDEGAAPVGVVETTRLPKEYPHTNNEMLKWWDLPGVGSPTFPRETYLATIDVDSYDCFVIVTSKRFTENDVWLARAVAERKKKFYFVGANVNADVVNDMYGKSSKPKEEDVLKKIRENISELLAEEGFTNWVFLVDNHMRDKYDFDELHLTIIEDLPSLQRQAMLLSLSSSTARFVKLKVEVLRKKFWIPALLAASVATLPLFGWTVVCNWELLTREMTFNFVQLELDDASLRRRARFAKVNYDRFSEVVEREFPNGFGPAYHDSILKEGGYESRRLVSQSAQLYPFIGAIVAAPLSFQYTKFALNYSLDQMEKVSLELATYFPADKPDAE